MAGYNGWLVLEDSSSSGIVVTSNSIVSDADDRGEILLDESDEIDDSSDGGVSNGRGESPSPTVEEEENS